MAGGGTKLNFCFQWRTIQSINNPAPSLDGTYNEGNAQCTMLIGLCHALHLQSVVTAVAMAVVRMAAMVTMMPVTVALVPATVAMAPAMVTMVPATVAMASAMVTMVAVLLCLLCSHRLLGLPLCSARLNLLDEPIPAALAQKALSVLLDEPIPAALARKALTALLVLETEFFQTSNSCVLELALRSSLSLRTISNVTSPALLVLFALVNCDNGLRPCGHLCQGFFYLVCLFTGQGKTRLLTFNFHFYFHGKLKKCIHSHLFAWGCEFVCSD